MTKTGRPPIWTDPQQLQELIDKYFEHEDKPTFAGLAYFIGISRSTLYEYKKKDGFSDTIKKARDRMFQVYEGLLIYGGKNVAGIIFALKNTGWSDRVETDITSGGRMIKPLLGGMSVHDSNNSNGKTRKTQKKN